MDKNNRSEQPQRRRNLLNGSWVLVSPHRTQRPWQGQVEEAADAVQPPFDPDCYLCPGNTRASGDVNTKYTDTYVFDNDYPALLQTTATADPSDDELLVSADAGGTCRVICYSPRHDQSLGDLSAEALDAVVATWVQQISELGKDFSWVQVFENRGEMMGCSNPHPHGQVWATEYIPEEVRREDHEQRQYFERNGSPLLHDYAQRELESGERLVLRTEHWLVVVPYWATWPFETLLLPIESVPDLAALDTSQRRDLGTAVARLQKTYDRLFGVPFPYSMGWHYAPPGANSEHWCVHAHFNPPLLRSATVRKFMVGFEMFAEPQRDLTPEQAACQLRSVMV